MTQNYSFVYGFVLDADRKSETPLILSHSYKENGSFQVYFYGIFHIFATGIAQSV